MPTPAELAHECAAKLLETWSIGTFSRFMDEPADFDSPSTEELAAALLPFMERARATLYQLPN